MTSLSAAAVVRRHDNSINHIQSYYKSYYVAELQRTNEL